MSNLNVPRIDDGAKLADADLDNAARMSWPARRTHTGCTGACNQGRLPCRAPDACGMPIDEPARKAGIQPGGIALIVLFLLSAGLVGFALVTGWRLARGLFS